jgi:hypothetical protein
MTSDSFFENIQPGRNFVYEVVLIQKLGARLPFFREWSPLFSKRATVRGPGEQVEFSVIPLLKRSPRFRWSTFSGGISWL